MRACASAQVFLLACCSTSFITLANIYATTGMAGSGLLTTVWVTAIIVGSNVIIFVMVPQALRRAAPRRTLHCIALHTRHIA